MAIGILTTEPSINCPSLSDGCPARVAGCKYPQEPCLGGVRSCSSWIRVDASGLMARKPFACRQPYCPHKVRSKAEIAKDLRALRDQATLALQGSAAYFRLPWDAKDSEDRRRKADGDLYGVALTFGREEFCRLVRELEGLCHRCSVQQPAAERAYQDHVAGRDDRILAVMAQFADWVAEYRAERERLAASSLPSAWHYTPHAPKCGGCGAPCHAGETHCGNSDCRSTAPQPLVEAHSSAGSVA